MRGGCGGRPPPPARAVRGRGGLPGSTAAPAEAACRRREMRTAGCRHAQLLTVLFIVDCADTQIRSWVWLARRLPAGGGAD